MINMLQNADKRVSAVQSELDVYRRSMSQAKKQINQLQVGITALSLLYIHTERRD